MSYCEPVYTDNCPACLEGPHAPTGTRIEGADLVGDYACTECGHMWRCWWNISTLPSDGASAGDAA
ncbi:hypothetical protein [Actinomadura sp. CNU-125]|uniref:hypothetical protein n=1 Tax=Actinomadura sp. CNU-125 TaxID=1904961 RepID=UPI00117786F7|nr:hypothetical protein [Actinomadura sp. CNU-125]